MQAAVAQVMGRVPSFKVELALKYIKSKLTDFRSEERRKVLHISVTGNHSKSCISLCRC